MSQHHQLIKNDPRWKAARAACLERDGYACVECGTTEDLQADHVIELEDLVAGGDLELAFEVENLQTLCGLHNREKHLAGPVEYRTEWISDGYPEISAAIEKARTAGSLDTPRKTPAAF